MNIDGWTLPFHFYFLFAFLKLFLFQIISYFNFLDAI